MKALTLWQPWATLIAIGAKKIETRSWLTHYRGPLAIHAAKKMNSDLLALMETEPFVTALETAGLYVGKVRGECLPLGCVLAIVDLVDCVPITPAFVATLGEPERSFGDYRPGRWAWILENVRKLHRPIYLRGAHGLWDLETSFVLADHEGLKTV